MQTLEFQFTRDDYRAFLDETAPQWWDYSLRWSIGGAIAIGLAVGLLESTIAVEIDRTLFAVLLLGILVLLGWLGRRWRRHRELAQFAPPDGPTRIEVTRTGITIRENGVLRTMSWDAMAGVAIGDSQVTLGGPANERIVIPRHAFADRNDMVGFFGYCEARLADEPDDAAQAARKETETDMTGTARTVSVALRGEDWRAVRDGMNSGKTILSFGQSGLLTTVVGGIISGGIAALTTRIMGREFDPLLWAVFAWPGAIALTWLAARHYDKSQRALGEATWPQQQSFTLAIDERGLTRRADGLMLQLAWPVVARIESVGGAILFALPWNEFIIAPRHAFPTEQDYRGFLETAQSWQRAAQGTQASRWEQLSRDE